MGLKDYNIKFQGLKDAIHNFDFEVNDDFFTHFPQSDIQHGKVKIHVQMDKKVRFMVFYFNLDGFVILPCDRCLELMEIPVVYEAKLIVEFGEENSDITDIDERMTLARTEPEIELAQHIYEYINLSLPYRKVHPDDANGESTCNADMLAKLDELNTIEEETETDPRWDKLKGLLN